VRGCGPPSIQSTTPTTVMTIDSTTLYVTALGRPPALGSRPRGADAASPLLTGLARAAGLHTQRPGALEGVHHDCLHGGPWERFSAPPAKPLDQAGRAIDLPHSLHGGGRSPPSSRRAKSLVPPTFMAQQYGAHPSGLRSCSAGSVSTWRGTSGSGPRRSNVSIASHNANPTTRIRRSWPTSCARSMRRSLVQEDCGQQDERHREPDEHEGDHQERTCLLLRTSPPAMAPAGRGVGAHSAIRIASRKLSRASRAHCRRK